MSQPAYVMRVRFKSALSPDKLRETVERRAPDFEALPGLLQKYYLHDAATGEVAGLYLWESREALAAYRHSALRATIAEAYQTVGEPDLEVYEVFKVLREDGA